MKEKTFRAKVRQYLPTIVKDAIQFFVTLLKILQQPDQYKLPENLSEAVSSDCKANRNSGVDLGAIPRAHHTPQICFSPWIEVALSPTEGMCYPGAEQGCEQWNVASVKTCSQSLKPKKKN